jgi:hypothetical protein
MAVKLFESYLLPGNARRWMGMLDGTRGRLYLGRDHVLHIHDGRFQEESRRFYLRDIQAISIRPSTERGWAIVGLLLLIIPLFIPAVLLGYFEQWEFQQGFLVGGGVLSLVPLALIVLNLALGPRCHCCLHTAAHTEELYGQSRLRTALEVRATLERSIRMAQPAMPAPAPEAAAPTPLEPQG